MAYTQVRGFNTALAGIKPGYCLQNVRLGFSIPAKYEYAIQAWENTVQHTDAIPTGLAVPLFYNYTVNGTLMRGTLMFKLANGSAVE